MTDFTNYVLQIKAAVVCKDDTAKSRAIQSGAISAATTALYAATVASIASDTRYAGRDLFELNDDEVIGSLGRAADDADDALTVSVKKACAAAGMLEEPTKKAVTKARAQHSSCKSFVKKVLPQVTTNEGLLTIVGEGEKPDANFTHNGLLAGVESIVKAYKAINARDKAADKLAATAIAALTDNTPMTLAEYVACLSEDEVDELSVILNEHLKARTDVAEADARLALWAASRLKELADAADTASEPIAANG